MTAAHSEASAEVRPPRYDSVLRPGLFQGQVVWVSGGGSGIAFNKGARGKAHQHPESKGVRAGLVRTPHPC